MSTDPSEQRWARLAKAARSSAQTRASDDLPDSEQIRTRFQGMTETIRGMFLLVLWKRWALLAVILSLLGYAAVYVFIGRGKSTEPDPPTISIPLPP